MAFVSDYRRSTRRVPCGGIHSGIGLVRHWSLPLVAAALVRAAPSIAFRLSQFLAGATLAASLVMAPRQSQLVALLQRVLHAPLAGTGGNLLPSRRWCLRPQCCSFARY